MHIYIVVYEGYYGGVFGGSEYTVHGAYTTERRAMKAMKELPKEYCDCPRIVEVDLED